MKFIEAYEHESSNKAPLHPVPELIQ